jgi:hypothetical protein
MSIHIATGVLIGPRPPNVSPAARRRGRLIIGSLMVGTFALGACFSTLFGEIRRLHTRETLSSEQKPPLEILAAPVLALGGVQGGAHAMDAFPKSQI